MWFYYNGFIHFAGQTQASHAALSYKHPILPTHSIPRSGQAPGLCAAPLYTLLTHSTLPTHYGNRSGQAQGRVRCPCTLFQHTLLIHPINLLY